MVRSHERRSSVLLSGNGKSEAVLWNNCGTNAIQEMRMKAGASFADGGKTGSRPYGRFVSACIAAVFRFFAAAVSGRISGNYL